VTPDGTLLPQCLLLSPVQLDLGYNQIGDAGAAALAQALAANHTVIFVCLTCRSCACVTVMAEACNGCLQRRRGACGVVPADRHFNRGCSSTVRAQLYLNNNQVGDGGAMELAKALATNHTMTAVCCACSPCAVGAIGVRCALRCLFFAAAGEPCFSCTCRRTP